MQRQLSRKYEFRKKKGGISAAASANIDKQNSRCRNFITTEDVNVKDMYRWLVGNRHCLLAVQGVRIANAFGVQRPSSSCWACPEQKSVR